MTGFKAYPRYQDSSVAWLGMIPAEWSIRALRYLAIVETGSKDSVNAVPDGSYPFVVRSKNLLRIDSFSYDTEAILTAGDGDVGEVFHHLTGRFDVHQRVYVLRHFQGIVARYLFYYFSSQFKRVVAYGGALTTVASLRRPMFTSFPVLVPPRVEQVAISLFLDRETAEIDAFIADQEQLIGLLAERRTATISNAVTTGVPPAHQVLESEIPWIGSIPPHWVATRISRYFAVTLGKMLDAGKVRAEGTLILPYIRAANIQEWGLDLTSLNEMPFTPGEAAALNIRRGDLLVVEGGAVGVNVFVDSDLDGVSFQKTVNRVRPKSEMGVSRFLGFVLDHLRWTGVIDMVANKSTIAHLTAEKLERIVVAFPPRSEQEAIVDYLDRETAELDAAIADAREAIVLSKERRAALISAAVTGKIDVRGAA